jgi:hypothetical protein
MRTCLAASAGVLLVLAGCTMPSTPGQPGYGGTHPVISNSDPTPNYRATMTDIGNEYAADLSWHDPSRVSSDVQSCYMTTGNGSIQGIYGIQNTRMCLALDYLAYKDNQVATHNYKLAGNPYFSQEAAGKRWEIYGPRAGFNDPDAMFSYMRGTYAFTKPAQLNTTNSIRPMARLPGPGDHLPSFMGH